MDEAILEKWEPTKLNIRITAKSEKMNAYIYEGRTRESSKQSLKTDNTQLVPGDTFSVDVFESGFFLVFYHEDDTESEFGFEYWVEATLKPEPEPAGEGEDQES